MMPVLGLRHLWRRSSSDRTQRTLCHMTLRRVLRWDVGASSCWTDGPKVRHTHKAEGYDSLLVGKHPFARASVRGHTRPGSELPGSLVVGVCTSCSRTPSDDRPGEVLKPHLRSSAFDHSGQAPDHRSSFAGEGRFYAGLLQPFSSFPR